VQFRRILTQSRRREFKELNIFPRVHLVSVDHKASHGHTVRDEGRRMQADDRNRTEALIEHIKDLTESGDDRVTSKEGAGDHEEIQRKLMRRTEERRIDSENFWETREGQGREMIAYQPLDNEMWACGNCIGFNLSVLAPDRCSACNKERSMLDGVDWIP
jgi:rubrerythrin